MVRIKFNTKVNASSLFETIVALMVIVIVFGISMTIYVNVVRTSSTMSEYKVSLKLEAIARETKERKSYFDESFEEEGVRIEKRVGKYKGVEGVLLLSIEASDKTNRLLTDRKEIIKDDTNE